MPAPAPIVTGVNPNSGPASGGTVVTISGANFSASGTSIKFDATPATNISCNATTCTATSPAGTGTVDIVVTVGNQSSAFTAADRFTYVAPAPTVTGISPASGTTAGGTVVTISGTNFSASGTSDKFGANTAMNVSCSTTSCIATSPAGSGIVDVIVTVGGQSSAITNAEKFAYVVPAPTVTGISPNSGLGAGGTVVTISGTNFNVTPGATMVKFGANTATNVSCASASSCTATSPAGSGIVDVVVTVGGQSSAVNNNDKFTYVSMTTVYVPVPALSKGFGYSHTFTSNGAGTISVTWTMPKKISGKLSIYAGNPFAGMADPLKLSPPAGALVTLSANNTTSYNIITTSLPAGQYTVYFFSSTAVTASNGQVVF